MTTADPVNIKGFKKAFNNFLKKKVKDNERGVHRKLRRDMVGSKSFHEYRSGSLSLGASPARGAMSQAITLEAYESPIISPREQLKLKVMGKSEKDLKKYLEFVSPRLDRRNSFTKSELEFNEEINKQLNNLRSESSPKRVRSDSMRFRRRDSF